MNWCPMILAPQNGEFILAEDMEMNQYVVRCSKHFADMKYPGFEFDMPNFIWEGAKIPKDFFEGYEPQNERDLTYKFVSNLVRWKSIKKPLKID